MKSLTFQNMNIKKKTPMEMMNNLANHKGLIIKATVRPQI